jgi:hypothetical protein
MTVYLKANATKENIEAAFKKIKPKSKKAQKHLNLLMLINLPVK